MDYRFKNITARVTTENLGTENEKLSVVVEGDGHGELLRFDNERELKELVRRLGFEDGWDNKKEGRFKVGFRTLSMDESETEDFLIEVSDAQGKYVSLTEGSSRDLRQLLTVVERAVSDSRQEVARSLTLEHGPDRPIGRGR
jgi:hypothetical protein